MAAPSIASASSGGKSAFDRAAIFRSAHENARRKLRWSGFKGTYRQAFSIALRAVYYAERQAPEERASMATLPPIPADVEERARELEADAYWSPINRTGNDRYSLLMGQARALREEAREAAIAARELREAAAEPDDQLVLNLGSLVPRSCTAAVAASLT